MIRLQDHLGKSSWAFVDKSLPLIYGFFLAFVVIRTIPKGEFGIYIIIQSVATFILSVNQNLVIRPMIKYISAKTDNRKWVLPSSFIITLFLVTPIIATVTILSKNIGNLLNIQEFGSYIHLIWLLTFLMVLKSYNTALQNSIINTRNIFFINFVYFATSITILTWLKLQTELDTALDILYSNVVSYILSITLGICVNRKLLKGLQITVNKTHIRKILSFGKYSFIAGMGHTLFQQSDNYIISGMLNPVQVGVYNSAKIFLRFYNAIHQAIITLVFPIISKLHYQNRYNDVKNVGEKAIGFYSFIIIPINIVLFIFSKSIFNYIYAGKYPDAYIIFRIILVGLSLHPLLSISGSILLGISKPRYNAISKLISLPTNIILNLLLIPRMGVYGSAVAVTCYYISESLFLFTIAKKETRISLRGCILRYRDIISFAKNITKRKS